MAMKPSSKFERMKLKPSQTMAKPNMPTGGTGEGYGAAEPMAVMKPMQSKNPLLEARKKAMQKASQPMGKR